MIALSSPVWEAEPSAFRESDMVVELMQKFMEAGFPQETAIRMMNSAMVLQGADSVTFLHNFLCGHAVPV